MACCLRSIAQPATRCWFSISLADLSFIIIASQCIADINLLLARPLHSYCSCAWRSVLLAGFVHFAIGVLSYSRLLSTSSPALVCCRRLLLLSSAVGVLFCSRLLSASSLALVWCRRPLLLSSAVGVLSCSRLLSASSPALVCCRCPLLLSSAVGVLSCSCLLSASCPAVDVSLFFVRCLLRNHTS